MEKQGRMSGCETTDFTVKTAILTMKVTRRMASGSSSKTCRQAMAMAMAKGILRVAMAKKWTRQWQDWDSSDLKYKF